MGRRSREKHNHYSRIVYQSLVLISQFGINMLVPIFLLTFLGIFLDRKLETDYLVIILFFIGALAGFRNIFKMAKNIYEKQDKSRYGETEKKENK